MKVCSDCHVVSIEFKCFKHNRCWYCSECYSKRMGMKWEKFAFLSGQIVCVPSQPEIWGVKTISRIRDIGT
jgi:hypothetical protein